MLDALFALIYIKTNSGNSMIYRFDNFELDTKKFELRKDGDAVHVEPQIYDFLYFIIQHEGRVVTRDEIIEGVWNGRIVSDTTISSCVKSARKILGDDGENQKYIKTARGRGFQFVGTIEGDTAEQVDVSSESSRKSTSQLSRKKIAILVIGSLLFIIGLLLSNQFQFEDGDGQVASSELVSSGSLNTIAVMPFVDMSADGNQEYFGNGISEEVLNVLTAVDGLDVTSRTTAFSLRDENLSVPEIAERLNVNYIVEGSVRSSGERIRITVQLVDASNDVHLWSEKYDRELTDIFAIQDDISQKISEALKVELIEKMSTSEVPTTNMDAYALYLQGHQLFLDRGTGDIEQNIGNLKRATAMLDQVVIMDPNFAEAWADLASINIVLPTYFGTEYSFKRIAPRAADAADRAIELQPNLSQAWAVKGFIHTNLFEFQEAEVALKRSTELDPNNETAWLWLNLHYSSVGNHGEAQVAVERAIEIAPTSAIDYNVLGLVKHAQGNIDEAIVLQDKAVDEMGFELGRMDRSLLSMWVGNSEKALEDITKFYLDDDRISREVLDQKLNVFVNAYTDSTAREDALNILEDDVEQGITYTTFFGAMMVHDAKTMAHYFDTTTSNTIFNFRRLYFPMAQKLFDQKEFREYLIKIGLFDYWKNNKFPDFCQQIGETDFNCHLDGR